jgi:hypothetical protein
MATSGGGSGRPPNRSFAMLSNVLVSLLFWAPAHSPAKPSDPFISRNVCPFECCVYRDWVAQADVKVYDKPNGSVILTLHKDEHVTGLTGEVHAHPVRFVFPRRDREHKVPAGGVVYVLHDLGEGFSRVWYRGTLLDVEIPDYDGPPLDYTWWAKIKTRSGRIGWVNMNASEFGNVDQCG